MSHRIFLSYRRSDDPGSTRLLYERLKLKFGEAVFRDREDIPVGADYNLVMREKVLGCDVILAVVGRQWLSIAGSNGRRLDEPHDPVRSEISTALSANKLVIPVLVAGSQMPRAEELPGDIAGFHYKNARELSEAHYDSDVELLVRDIRSALKAAEDDRAAAKASSSLGQHQSEVAQGRRDLIALLVPTPTAQQSVTSENLRLIHSCWRREDLDPKFKGMRMWQIHVMLAATPAVLDRIERVEYALDKSYPDPNRVNSDRSQFFGFYELANGASTVNAKVHIAGQRTPINLSRYISISDKGPNLKSLFR